MTESDYLFTLTVLAAMFVVASLFIFVGDLIYDCFTRRKR